jgi:flagellar hook-associated protein 1 FlgK
MSLDAAFSIARSGLAATQRALAQASQNIANAGTEGYTRKTVSNVSADYAGQPLGVRSAEARRDVDVALLAERDGRGAAAAAASARETLLAGIEAVQGRPEDATSLGNALGSLREAFTTLRANPAAPELARAALNAAQNLAGRMQDAGGAIQTARQQAQDGIVIEVDRANNALRQIAELNRLISTDLGAGRSTADMEDKRDLAISTLSETLPVRPLRQPDGGVVLMGRNGLTLPLPSAGEDILATHAAVTGPNSYYGTGGNLPGVMIGAVDVTRQMLGGRLGEYVTLRDQVLPRMQAEIDVAAVELAGRMDAQGLRLFTDASGNIPNRMLGYVGGFYAGFAQSIRVNSAVENNPAALRDGTHAVAAMASGPSAFSPNPAGGPAGFVTLLDRVLDHSLGSTAADGNPWPGFPSGGLGPDGSLTSAIANARNLEDYATQLVRVHTQARAEATTAKEAATSMQQGIAARISKQSGVDSDAEMAAMVQLQNAYAANARVMSTAQAMWDALMGAVR